MTMELADNRVPLDLLTGLLGAGKGTLLKHLFRGPVAGRIALSVRPSWGEPDPLGIRAGL